MPKVLRQPEEGSNNHRVESNLFSILVVDNPNNPYTWRKEKKGSYREASVDPWKKLLWQMEFSCSSLESLGEWCLIRTSGMLWVSNMSSLDVKISFDEGKLSSLLPVWVSKDVSHEHCMLCGYPTSPFSLRPRKICMQKAVAQMWQSVPAKCQC